VREGTSSTSSELASAAIRVVLIESVGVVRASLRLLFASEPDLVIIGDVADADEGLELAASLRGQWPAVALVGLELGGEHDSFWLIRSIRERSPELVILATGTDLDRSAVSQGLFAGADGFVHKNSAPERFVEATRRAAAGELVLEGLPAALWAVSSRASGSTPRRRSLPIVSGVSSPRQPTA
jgi:DNA-binding NarL/FixJ family response regulator